MQNIAVLVATGLRHVAGTRWDTRPYIDMERLRGKEPEEPTVARA